MTDRSTRGYIGSGLHITGTLSGEGDMIIDGRFTGDISIGGQLLVGEGARVMAPSAARAVTVGGDLIGEVHADHVVVQSTGKLTGDVHSTTIGLDDGGVLTGKVLMDFDLSDV